VKLDIREAYRCGRQAVKLASHGERDVMVTIERDQKRRREYHSHFGTVPLKTVAVNARPMPDEYIAESGFDVTPAYIDYIRPLVGELPAYATLKYKAPRVVTPATAE
jgi:6-phosphofructokinase 1